MKSPVLTFYPHPLIIVDYKITKGSPETGVRAYARTPVSGILATVVKYW
jgi:hypothetical protein